MEIKLGEKLKTLRKRLDYTQKEFAEFLEIPQPSLSAYENDKNSPTTEVLINIATKCNISLDWLCGLASSTNTNFSLNELKDLVSLLYMIMEIEEIGIEITVNDKLENDSESDNNKWYTQLTVYGNDEKFKHNSDLCQIISSINETINDLETYAISKDIYEIQKEKLQDYYENFPLTKKKIPDLNREERIKRHIEYLNSLTQ